MEIPELEPLVFSFLMDVFRLSVWLLLLLIVFVPIERLAGIHPQKVFRKSFAIDLTYYFLNSLIPKVLLAVPTALLAWGLHYVVPAGFRSWVADLAPPLRLAIALVVGEFGFYWGHRWAHQIPFLWRFHAVHHSAEEIDWLVNTRAHPLDIVFVRLCGLAPLYILGLAQPLAGQTVDTVPLLLMLGATMWGFFIHANIRWRFGWIGLLVSTPAFHHWHHTNDEHMNQNYASMLPFLDKLFGTWYMPKGQWPSKYGLDTPVASGLAGQFLEPLMPAANKPQGEVEAESAQAAG
ncbi:MAG TPA: sterol desaturase family protein [Bryobacteraceae bacterium]|nr:sterol desaturase family protein [Bryobacteraceae bacterium]